ncbi:MAG: flagellar basal-body rod protein FlgG [Pelotomaculum sp.]|jgi:flagellar basal-body rod protein FlgG
MLKALGSGASGLNAQQLRVDLLANNLANISTTGFKKSTPRFAELISQELLKSGIPVAEGMEQAELGSGVKVAEITREYEQGDLTETGKQTDLAINGEGFFRVLTPDGQERYTRDGSFSLDQMGHMVTDDGCRLDGIQIRPGANKIIISQKGIVHSLDDAGITAAGQINLYRFSNVKGLQAEGKNLYSFSGNAIDIIAGRPGSDGFGEVRQGYLELSNVNLIDELTNMIEAQRAYGFNARVVQTVDDFWSRANNLRK